MRAFSKLAICVSVAAAAASNDCAKDGSSCLGGEGAGDASLLQVKESGKSLDDPVQSVPRFVYRPGYCKRIEGGGVEKPTGQFSPKGLGQVILKSEDTMLQTACEHECIEKDGCKGFAIAPGVHKKCNLFSEAPDYTDTVSDQRWKCFTSGDWGQCNEECDVHTKTWQEKCTWDKKCAGCRECAAVAEMHRCADWCAPNTKPWAEKCTWHRACSQCQECDAADMVFLCGAWCGENTNPWSKKCTWTNKCNGCTECVAEAVADVAVAAATAVCKEVVKTIKKAGWEWW